MTPVRLGGRIGLAIITGFTTFGAGSGSGRRLRMLRSIHCCLAGRARCHGVREWRHVDDAALAMSDDMTQTEVAAACQCFSETGPASDRENSGQMGCVGDAVLPKGLPLLEEGCLERRLGCLALAEDLLAIGNNPVQKVLEGRSASPGSLARELRIGLMPYDLKLSSFVIGMAYATQGCCPSVQTGSKRPQARKVQKKGIEPSPSPCSCSS
jgi:hypothetical protein